MRLDERAETEESGGAAVLELDGADQGVHLVAAARHARRGGGLERHEAQADARRVHRVRRHERRGGERRRALNLDLDELGLLLHGVRGPELERLLLPRQDPLRLRRLADAVARYPPWHVDRLPVEELDPRLVDDGVRAARALRQQQGERRREGFLHARADGAERVDGVVAQHELEARDHRDASLHRGGRRAQLRPRRLAHLEHDLRRLD
eukprot:scaffold38650_cov36-Phaeocystis_antarctica.AAC.1